MARPLSNHQFWRVKKILALKDISIPQSIFDSFGNELSDPESIKNQSGNEFEYRLQREAEEPMKGPEQLQNYLPKLRLENCKKVESPDFTFKELKDVMDSFKNGKCRDTLDFIQEIFKRGGKSLFLSLLNMTNMIKRVKVFQEDWFKMALQTILKKKNGSLKILIITGISLLYLY